MFNLDGKLQKHEESTVAMRVKKVLERKRHLVVGTQWSYFPSRSSRL